MLDLNHGLLDEIVAFTTFYDVSSIVVVRDIISDAVR